ncbi:MAG TPA: hypothetical protein VJ793_22490 [Anaerolineae bacterium]|nr:hypothetical protein [Anaerolineae bacterium]
MSSRTRDVFTTLHSEGAILPLDLLQRVADVDDWRGVLLNVTRADGKQRRVEADQLWAKGKKKSAPGRNRTHTLLIRRKKATAYNLSTASKQPIFSQFFEAVCPVRPF